jgi:hypothetical protein
LPCNVGTLTCAERLALVGVGVGVGVGDAGSVTDDNPLGKGCAEMTGAAKVLTTATRATPTIAVTATIAAVFRCAGWDSDKTVELVAGRRVRASGDDVNRSSGTP